MEIVKLSSFYNWEKIQELRKLESYIILTSTGEKLFITHGNREGKIRKEENYRGLYDRVIACFINTDEQLWTSYSLLFINNEWNMYLMIWKTSESKYFDDNIRKSEIKRLYSEYANLE